MARSAVSSGSSNGYSPYRDRSVTDHQYAYSSDWEIERSPTRALAGQLAQMRPYAQEDYDNEIALQESVTKLLIAKSRPSSITGHFPFEPLDLTLFFRSKSGITHSLDFPIDVEFETPPALDVLIAACRPHPTDFEVGELDRESLFYPPSLPISITFEIANHPILDSVRSVLFPNLQMGHYLTVLQDKLEIVAVGGRMGRTSPSPSSIQEGRVATIIVTLPVRYRGGALVIRDKDGNQEKFFGRHGKPGDIEWTAFVSSCDHEIETVEKGCRVTMSYGVYIKSFGPSGIAPNPLILPSDYLLDTMAPILNMSRGRRIAFHLTGSYDVSPIDTVADTIVPHLSGGDSILYHAIKLYKLAPELRWTAGGYIWPVDSTVKLSSRNLPVRSAAFNVRSQPTSPIPSGRRIAYGRNVGQHKFTAAYHSDEEADDDEPETEVVQALVEGSGAVPIAQLDLFVLTDKSVSAPFTRQRVPYVSAGEINKLLISVLLVTYVP